MPKRGKQNPKKGVPPKRPSKAENKQRSNLRYGPQGSLVVPNVASVQTLPLNSFATLYHTFSYSNFTEGKKQGLRAKGCAPTGYCIDMVNGSGANSGAVAVMSTPGTQNSGFRIHAVTPWAATSPERMMFSQFRNYRYKKLKIIFQSVVEGTLTGSYVGATIADGTISELKLPTALSILPMQNSFVQPLWVPLQAVDATQGLAGGDDDWFYIDTDGGSSAGSRLTNQASFVCRWFHPTSAGAVSSALAIIWFDYELELLDATGNIDMVSGPEPSTDYGALSNDVEEPEEELKLESKVGEPLPIPDLGIEPPKPRLSASRIAKLSRSADRLRGISRMA